MPGQSTGNKTTTVNQSAEHDLANRPPINWQENFSEISLTDLSIGQKIMAMGQSNADGSITAEQIILGGAEAGWPGQNLNSRPPSNQNSQPGQGPNQPNNNFSTNRPNFQRWQNMTEEERQKLREEMPARRNNDNGQSGAAKSRITRANGEIMKIEDQMITLKLDNGGSKLIFLSNQTKILKPKANQPSQ
jgi:hypothetical protein